MTDVDAQAQAQAGAIAALRKSFSPLLDPAVIDEMAARIAERVRYTGDLDAYVAAISAVAAEIVTPIINKVMEEIAVMDASLEEKERVFRQRLRDEAFRQLKTPPTLH